MTLSKKVLKMIRKNARDHVSIALRVTGYMELYPQEDNMLNHVIRKDSEKLIHLISQDMMRDVRHTLELELEKSRIMPSQDDANLKKA